MVEKIALSTKLSFDAPPTLSSAVVAFIRDAILRGGYPPGSALPEIPLAREVGTSRTTIREALRSLSEAGLVTIHPRKGAFVSSMSARTARELFTLRSVLEAFAVRLALTEGKIRLDELARIEAAFDQMRRYRDSGNVYAMIEADMAFHWAVCSPCAHEMLLDHLKSLQTKTRQFIFYTKFYSSDAEGEVEAHMPILTAVRASAPEQAEGAMRNHIINAGERLLVSMLDGVNQPAGEADHERSDRS